MSDGVFARLLHRLNEPTVFIGNKAILSESGAWTRLDVICDILNSAFDKALASEVQKERERCAKIAEIEWMNGKNSIVRLAEITSDLGQRIADAIRRLPAGGEKETKGE